MLLYFGMVFFGQIFTQCIFLFEDEIESLLGVDLPARRFCLGLVGHAPEKLVGVLFDGDDGLVHLIVLVLQHLLRLFCRHVQ